MNPHVTPESSGIFAEDIDVVGPNVKPGPPLLPYSIGTKPLPVKWGQEPFRYKPINVKQAPVGKQKQSKKLKNKNKNKTIKNKKGKSKTPKAKIKQAKVPKQQRAAWLAQQRTALSLFHKKRSEQLKVAEGAAGPASPDLAGSGGVAVREDAESKPMEQDKANPAPPKVCAAAPAPAPAPAPAVEGEGSAVRRVPAAAFMRVEPPPARNVPHFGIGNVHLAHMQYPKGIPRSFLNKEHIQQLHTTAQQSACNPPSQGPVWEAKGPSSSKSIPTRMSRFDQISSGQYAPMSGQAVGQEGQPYQQDQMHVGQGYRQTGQGYGQIGQDFGQTGQGYEQTGQGYGQIGQDFGQTGQGYEPSNQGFGEQQMFVQTEPNMEDASGQYSPSDVYADMAVSGSNESSAASAARRPASKRLSAFQRLGPLTQPKKPKLTINLLLGKEQVVREVVDESPPGQEKYLPVLQRADIQTSLDDTVVKYLTFWPWKKPASVRRAASAKDSRHAMQMEMEQMDEYYEKDKLFFGISVTGYPESWNKNDVLDAVLEAVKGKSFIPCFVEFGKQECKFLVIRNREALLAIHQLNFSYQKEEVTLKLSIMHVNLSVNQIDFLPRLVLRRRLSMGMRGDAALDLTGFTLAHDVSHFLYFPLSRAANQTELMQLQSSVPWGALTSLVLARNNIATLSGFSLAQHTPRLRHLDLSHNRLTSVTALLSLRELPLASLALEGNPLCTDYTDPDRYTKVLKMMFSGLKEIDGVKLRLRGEFPPYERNYCPPEAAPVVARLLETLFPLLDGGPDERRLLPALYADDAMLTVTYTNKLRHSPAYAQCRTLFARARSLRAGELDAVRGAPAVGKVALRWPRLEHDPRTFSVDVLHHAESTTVVRVGGIMRVSPESLAEDEHLLQFSRTLVLHAAEQLEYKITNELLHWDLPDPHAARGAFALATVRSKNLNLNLDGPPDAELKENLLEIFMALTDLDKKPSERCLESNEWRLRDALEYFTKLLKSDNLEPLFQ